MKIYSAHGINDFVICCGYKGYVIKEYFANYFLHMSDVTFDLAENRDGGATTARRSPGGHPGRHRARRPMTGGRLKRVREYLGDETFCFTYGDGVADVDITGADRLPPRAGRAGHGDRGAAARPLRRARLRRATTRVQRFEEKPRGDGALDQRRLLRAGAGGARLRRRRRHDVGARARWSAWPRRGSWPPIEHHGFWQPHGHTARQGSHLEELVGRRRRRPGRSGNERRRFWQGKRVLLTGHTGFKGSWLSLWLQRLGARGAPATRCPRPPSPACSSVARVAEGMPPCRAATSATAAARRRRSQAAARGGVPPGRAAAGARSPTATRSRPSTTNVMGTVAPARGGARGPDRSAAVVVVTSDKCYENREWLLGLPRGRALGGHDPYSGQQGLRGAGHRSLPRARSSAEAQRSAAVATARAGNVIGGGDWAPDRLVPDVVRAPIRAGAPGADPQPARDPPLAARAGAARAATSCSPSGSAARAGVRRGLELRAARRGRAGRWLVVRRLTGRGATAGGLDHGARRPAARGGAT